MFCSYRLWREAQPQRVLFWVAALLGIALLTQQLRMNYFGSFALYLPWIVAIDDRAGKSMIAWSVTAAVLLLAWIPGFTHRLFLHSPVGDDRYYQITRRIYGAFADECAREPGVALADPYDGHYVRYHTNCSVIANPFLLTPQHEEKFKETSRLMALSAAQLLSAAPYLKYVYVRRNNIFYRGPRNSIVIMPRGNPDDPDPPLVHELLATHGPPLPPGFKLVKELYFPDNADAPYARLFAITAP